MARSKQHCETAANQLSWPHETVAHFIFVTIKYSRRERTHVFVAKTVDVTFAFPEPKDAVVLSE
jgi:hypothetical protein